MPVTFGSAGTGFYQSSANVAGSWNHTVAADHNLVIVTICPGLNVSLTNGNDAMGPNDVVLTFDGVAMKFLASTFRCASFYLEIGGSGTKTVNLNPNGKSYTWAANSMSFKGAGKIGTPVTALQQGSPHTVTAQGPANGMVVFSVGETYASPLNSYTGATLAFWTNTSGNNSAGGFYAVSDGVTSSTVTTTNNTQWGGAIGIPLSFSPTPGVKTSQLSAAVNHASIR
jgi:hypothetical protein